MAVQTGENYYHGKHTKENKHTNKQKQTRQDYEALPKDHKTMCNNK